MTVETRPTQSADPADQAASSRSGRDWPAAGGSPLRPTRIEVDLDAVAENVRALRAHVGPAALWAVVKADGYGHGAVAVAHAALAVGAEGLAVALVEEAEAVRAAGIDAPVMLLSEPPPDGADRAVAAGVEPTVYSAAAIAALGRAADRQPGALLAVHLKVDTGMHRVGAQPTEAPGLAAAIHAHPRLTLASVWTHLAVADEPESEFTTEQLVRFHAACAAIEASGVQIPCRHAANSAGALAHPAARLDRVRIGIALYGIAPAPTLAGIVELQPALRLTSSVSHVKVVAAGEAVSYGQHHRVERDTVIATVPIGYADGLRRSLAAAGGQVLIGGRRRLLAGTVTMDQVTVDCDDDGAVRRGDEVVLIGRQGEEEISVEEWAERLGTIGYEITCGLGPRLPRHSVGGT